MTHAPRPRQNLPAALALLALCLAQGAHAKDTPAAPAERPVVQTAEQVESAAERSLSGIEGLARPDATLNAGTLVITGVADDTAVRARATEAVADATGIDPEHIDNRIDLSLNLPDRTRGAANRLNQRAQIWIGYLPLVPVAIAMLVLFAIIAWLIGRLAWPFSRFTRNPFLQGILRKLAQTGAMLTGVLLALEILDAMALVGGVLGAAGVAGIAIGFAFKDLIENYIASILLSLRRPFNPGDQVRIDNHEGLISSMDTRTTILTTFEGNTVRIPNATVFKTTLVNYTADPRRRFEFTVQVGYDVELARAVELGVQTLLGTEGVMADPAPFALVANLGDSSITIQLFAWVDQSANDFGKVRSVALQRVKNRYDQEDIDMPEPIYKIRLDQAPAPTPSPTPSPASQRPVPAPPRPAAGAKPAPQPVNPDTAPDTTVADMARRTADAQTGENLLGERAAP